LDAAIANLFNLDPKYAPIVTVNIDLNRKVNIVHCAVDLQVDSGKSFSIDVKDLFKRMRGVNNPLRLTVAHSSFEAGEPDGVQFRRSVATSKLDVEDPLWTEADFKAYFETLRRLEGDLRQVISELESEKIEWPPSANVAPMSVQGGFFADVDFVGDGFVDTRKVTNCGAATAVGRKSRPALSRCVSPNRSPRPEPVTTGSHAYREGLGTEGRSLPLRNCISMAASPDCVR
jgi:hypothetical protein